MIDYYRAIGSRDVDEDLLERDRKTHRRAIESIFEEYCEAGSKAKRFRSSGMAFDIDTPDYDLSQEQFVSISEVNGRIVVETKQINKLRLKFRYELTDTGGQWKIRDNKRWGSNKDGTWHPDVL